MTRIDLRKPAKLLRWVEEGYNSLLDGITRVELEFLHDEYGLPKMKASLGGGQFIEVEVRVETTDEESGVVIMRNLRSPDYLVLKFRDPMDWARMSFYLEGAQDLQKAVVKQEALEAARIRPAAMKRRI